MSEIGKLEMIQAEIKYLTLRLEFLKHQEEVLKEKFGDRDYSGHPYVPK